MSKFNVRGFVSLVLGLSFLIVLVSGLVLWLAHSPQTFGIGHGVWKHVHIFTSLLVGAAAIGHFVLNWSKFLCYLWPTTSDRRALKWEAIGAVLLVVVIVGAAAMHGPSPKGRHGPPNQQNAERQR